LIGKLMSNCPSSVSKIVSCNSRNLEPNLIAVHTARTSSSRSLLTSLGVFNITWKESIPRAQHLVRILVTVEGEVSTSPTLRFLFLPFFDDMRRAFGCGLLGESCGCRAHVILCTGLRTFGTIPEKK
jgi:hypothetical protein